MHLVSRWKTVFIIWYGGGGGEFPEKKADITSN